MLFTPQCTSVQVALRSPVVVQQVLVLGVSEDLSDYIAVAPERIGRPPVGTPVQITITLKSLPPGESSQGGVVQVRTGDRSLGKPLKVKVRAARDKDGD